LPKIYLVKLYFLATRSSNIFLFLDYPIFLFCEISSVGVLLVLVKLLDDLSYFFYPPDKMKQG